MAPVELCCVVLLFPSCLPAPAHDALVLDPRDPTGRWRVVDSFTGDAVELPPDAPVADCPPAWDPRARAETSDVQGLSVLDGHVVHRPCEAAHRHGDLAPLALG